MADARRLTALTMVPELAKEVAAQIETGGAYDPADIPANSAAADVAALRTDFNALLAVLRGD